MSNAHECPTRRGTTLVEAALVLSTCMLFCFGIYEYGRFLMLKNLLTNAAREGARLAVVNTDDYSTSQIRDAIDAVLAGQGNQLQGYNKSTSITVFRADSLGNQIGTDWNNAKFGESVGVKITGNYQPILASFLGAQASFPISVTAIMNSEAN